MPGISLPSMIVGAENVMSQVKNDNLQQPQPQPQPNHSEDKCSAKLLDASKPHDDWPVPKIFPTWIRSRSVWPCQSPKRSQSQCAWHQPKPWGKAILTTQCSWRMNSNNRSSVPVMTSSLVPFRVFQSLYVYIHIYHLGSIKKMCIPINSWISQILSTDFLLHRVCPVKPWTSEE